MTRSLDTEEPERYNGAVQDCFCPPQDCVYADDEYKQIRITPSLFALLPKCPGATPRTDAHVEETDSEEDATVTEDQDEISDNYIEDDQKHFDRWTLLNYRGNALKHLYFTLSYHWTMIFTSPISVMMAVVSYLTLIISLVSLYVIFKVPQAGKIKDLDDQEFLANDDAKNLVMDTIPLMAKNRKQCRSQKRTFRVFDMLIAQTLLTLSTLLYQRDGALLQEARSYFRDNNKAKGASTLRKAMEKITSQAKIWGLSFYDATGLSSVEGPLCGIYTSRSHPVIVVAFKGTSPDNFEEIFVDAALQRVDARPYLFGATHLGFYEYLFSNSGMYTNSFGSTYSTIIQEIDRRADGLRKKLGTKEKVKLWITGHSLGAALSTLLFARLLKHGKDDLEHCELQDCYTFGSPAVGDNDFASMFASLHQSYDNNKPTMWRVINNKDVVCKIPLAKNDRTVGYYIGKTDYFNYFHVGHAIHLDSASNTLIHEAPSCYESAIKIAVKMCSCRRAEGKGYDQGEEAPGRIIEWLRSMRLFSFREHFPSRYRRSLLAVSEHYAEKMGSNKQIDPIEQADSQLSNLSNRRQSD
ncbi:hypothetical protein EC973_002961 [Apophysomyces ossiformis]|uniref:Fungal lipase-type domain-containing protein n=1 Tax=Apophysomyces ossiformis TaxID=679940 RepID=A0A8H7EQU7_9FUNG|nr:hypothetical protein EC973_002961 [Apophysomyces ossiformis]